MPDARRAHRVDHGGLRRAARADLVRHHHPHQFREWRTGLDRVDVHGDAITEHSSFGAMTYRFVHADPPRRASTAIAHGKELGFEGDWTFQMQPSDGGTRLTITERRRLFNPVFRLLARFVFGFDRTLKTCHADLDQP